MWGTLLETGRGLLVFALYVVIGFMVLLFATPVQR